MKVIDLNLLRTFDALMEYRSVTRAASHLGITQPAVSHALARLRATLNDPLFIRGGSGLQPTARAEEIADGIHKGLSLFADALAATPFNPAQAERRFTIAANSYFCLHIIPSLVERVRQTAPGISLELVPTNEALVSLLDRGIIDLALGASLESPSRIVTEPLYREKLVWISAPDNPIVRDRTPITAIAEALRITIVPHQIFEPPVALSGTTRFPRNPLSRDRPQPDDAPNRLVVYDSLTAVELVSRTDLVAQVPERTARRAARQGQVVTLDWIPPDSFYQIILIWHARRRSDQGLAWLRALLHGSFHED